jgi:hypothetical protein
MGQSNLPGTRREQWQPHAPGREPGALQEGAAVGGVCVQEPKAQVCRAWSQRTLVKKKKGKDYTERPLRGLW